MNHFPTKKTWQRAELIQLFSLAGNLAGLCITGVALFYTVARSRMAKTLADNTLACAALLFLVCTYIIFIALRTRRKALAVALEEIADILFLLGLTGMVGAGFIMVYTVW